MLFVPVWVLLVALVVGSAYLYSKRCHSYWAKRGVPSPPALPFLGHIHEIMRLNPGRFNFDYKVSILSDLDLMFVTCWLYVKVNEYLSQDVIVQRRTEMESITMD